MYAYNRLGIAFRRQKKFNEAVALYRKAIAINPEEENLYYNLARAYIGAKDEQMAVTALKRALKIREDFKEAQDLLDKILY